MLFKFKSQATSDLIMLEADARRLLKIMLRDDPVKGIVQAKDLPQTGLLPGAATKAPSLKTPVLG